MIAVSFSTTSDTTLIVGPTQPNTLDWESGNVHDAELHAAVLAAPDDDGPRLVYADWLMQRGDPRGEMIALQIAQAQLPTGDPKLVELARREDELRDAHRKQWYAPYRTAKGRLHVGFVRGFVETLGGTPADLAAMADGVLEDTCIRRLTWGTRYEGDRAHGGDATVMVETIARLLPRLRLRELAIGPPEIPIASLQVLLAALDTGPTRLAAFSIHGSVLGNDHLSAIVDAPALAGLRSLELRACHLDGATLRALGTWAPPELRELRLAQNPIGEGYIAILARPAFAKLERLDLDSTQIGAEDVRAIVDAGLPLVALELGGNPLGPAAIDHLTRERFGDRLDRLGLADTGIGVASLDALVASTLPRLELGLDGVILGLEKEISSHDGPWDPIGWKSPPSSTLTARFRIKVEGSP